MSASGPSPNVAEGPSPCGGGWTGDVLQKKDAEELRGWVPCFPVSSACLGSAQPSLPAPVPSGPAQSGILVDREVVSLFLHFTVNPKPRVDFIDRPRCCLRGKECSVNRFQQVESRWGYSGTSDRIR